MSDLVDCRLLRADDTAVIEAAGKRLVGANDVASIALVCEAVVADPDFEVGETLLWVMSEAWKSGEVDLPSLLLAVDARHEGGAPTRLSVGSGYGRSGVRGDQVFPLTEGTRLACRWRRRSSRRQHDCQGVRVETSSAPVWLIFLGRRWSAFGWWSSASTPTHLADRVGLPSRVAQFSAQDPPSESAEEVVPASTGGVPLEQPPGADPVHQPEVADGSSRPVPGRLLGETACLDGLRRELQDVTGDRELAVPSHQTDLPPPPHGSIVPRPGSGVRGARPSPPLGPVAVACRSGEGRRHGPVGRIGGLDPDLLERRPAHQPATVTGEGADPSARARSRRRQRAPVGEAGGPWRGVSRPRGTVSG